MTLAWDASSGSVAGYRVHYGTISDAYKLSVDVGNFTSCTISGLNEGTTYYFAVTAYDLENNESDYSEELAYNISSAPALTCELDLQFEEAILTNHIAYYTDRIYELTDVPSKYIGMEMIKTPNNNRNLTAAGDYLTFEMPYDGTVYVAFDGRASSTPNWLSGFSDTGDVIYTSLSSQPYLKLYSKAYSAGTCVNFGGNRAPGFSGGTVSNYMVMYSEGTSASSASPSSSSLDCVLDSRFEEAILTNHIAYYTDRIYELTSVPSKYIGMEMIKTPNSNRKLTAAGDYLTFEMPYDGTVYVAFDSRASSTPNWMRGFSGTGDVIYTSNSTQPHLKVYSKAYSAGSCVNFGGNMAAGFSGGTVSNYMVMYAEGK